MPLPVTAALATKPATTSQCFAFMGQSFPRNR